jgi:O-antigen/teichoic acid export membrane protein
LASIFLSIYLERDEYGVFIIVSAFVNFFAYFSDVGLAAALIQKKDTVTEKDLKTTFTIQQLLVLIILAILFIISPYVSQIYHLNSAGKFLLYSLGISLFLSSLKTIPSVLLERELNFSKLVMPQVVESVIYNIVAVFLSWRGWGVASFTWAVLIRGIVGLVLMYVIKPWKPGFALDKTSLTKLLKFGAPYQLNTLIATIKDDGFTAFLGGVLGADGVGILGWAQKWAQYPLRLFLDQVLKVTFPAFSRMQDNKNELKNSLTRSIFFVCFLVFPALTGLLIIAPLLIHIVPKWGKWQPAIIPLYFISINIFFAAATTQLTNLLNAIGKIKTTFKLMLMWTSLTWLIIPFLSIKYGVNGAALGYAIVGASSVIAIILVQRIIKFSLRESVLPPLLASLIMGLLLFILKSHLPYNIISVFLLIICGIVIYLISMYLMVGKSIVIDAKKGFKSAFSR